MSPLTWILGTSGRLDTVHIPIPVPSPCVRVGPRDSEERDSDGPRRDRRTSRLIMVRSKSGRTGSPQWREESCGGEFSSTPHRVDTKTTEEPGNRGILTRQRRREGLVGSLRIEVLGWSTSFWFCCK